MNAFVSVATARLVQAVVVALVIGIISFAMMQTLPGDSAYRIAAGRYGYDVMDAQAAEMVRQELGLDRPYYQQLVRWLKQLVAFDLGHSLVSGEPVWHEISTQLDASLKLAFAAIITSLLIAVPVGFISGIRAGGIVDRLSLFFAIILRSVPTFVLGVVLMLLLAVQYKLLPVAGYGDINHFVLPTLALALSLAAVSNRVIRDAVTDAVASPWFQFARTKGLQQQATLRRHVARNVAAPAVAYAGVQLAFLIEGVVIIEAIFAWPGIGHALVHAIFERDVPMVQGTALTLGLMFVLLNFMVDVLCRLIDPRDRMAG